MNLLLFNKLLFRHKIPARIFLGLILVTCSINYFTTKNTDYIGFILMLSYAVIALDIQQTRSNNFVDVHHILHLPLSNLQKIFFLARNSFFSPRLLLFLPSVVLMAIFQSKMLVKILPILLLLYVFHTLISILILFYARRLKKFYVIIIVLPLFIFSFMSSWFINNTLGITVKLNLWLLSNYYGICLTLALLIFFFATLLILKFDKIVQNKPFINYKDFHKTYTQW